MIAHESTDISTKSLKGKGMVVCLGKVSFLLLALPVSKRMDVFAWMDILAKERKA